MENPTQASLADSVSAKLAPTELVSAKLPPPAEPWDIQAKYACLILLAMAYTLFSMRLHTYGEPIERDMGGYSTIAENILHGGRFFEGANMDQKPPLVHTTWALAQAVAGFGRGSIFLLNLLAGLGSMIGLYKAGTWITGRRFVGLWAAAFWTVVSGHLLLEANQPNTEVFINVFITFGFGLLLSIRGSANQTSKLILIGTCFAAATLYKHIVVVIPFFIGVGYLLTPPAGRSGKRAFQDLLLIASVGAFIWVAMIGYFAVTGRFQNLVLALVLFNKFYASSKFGGAGPIANVLHSLTLQRLFPPRLYFSLPFLGLVITGMLIAVRQQRRLLFPCLLLIGQAVGTQVAVALPGKFFPHYYQLWFPFLIIAASWGLGAILMLKPAPLRAVNLVGGVVLAILICIELPDYLTKTPVEWSRAKYGEIFVRTDQVATAINQLLLPDETFFQFGSECQLYTATGRRSPSIVCDYYAAMGPMAQMQTELMFKDFEKSPPDLLLVSKLAPIGPNYPLIPWLKGRYTLIRSLNFDPFFAFARNGSKFQQRLATAR